nr:hypothetical protein BaRGS_031207 [Batillaria attramentaria]
MSTYLTSVVSSSDMKLSVVFKPEYRPVADLFRKLVEDGSERGASFAVYHQGERLVELWGGGHLDYKKLVKDYWPEFAQNGKANVTVEMLLSHQAGLATMGGASVSLEEYKNDWKKVEKIMAAAAPEYPPGRSVGYHALTFGMYVDALIRRADPKHRNLTQFFQDEIAKPFGIDFFIGLPREQAWRAARGHLITSVEFFSLLLDTDHRYLIWNMLTSSDELFTKSGKAISGFDMDTSNDLTKLDVGVGSTMGFGAAGPLAKLYDYLANGGTIGKKQLLPKKIVDLPIAQHEP